MFPSAAPRAVVALARHADGGRRALWRIGTRLAIGRACARDRVARVSLLGAGHVAVAFACAVLAPVWLLLLGPVVLGVPHVISDVRFLLLRPERPLGRLATALVVAPLGVMTL